MRNYDKVFEIGPGKRVYIQSPRFKARGKKLVGQTLCLYQPAGIFYHYFACGGHVAALRRHASSKFLTRFDIRNFFANVTRTKLAGALHKIGYGQRAAFNAAYESVIVQNGVKALPIGFVQSPLFATLALERSLLGRCLLWLDGYLKVSVYMDDILISGDDRGAVIDASGEILLAANGSHFPFSTEKSAIAQREVVAFNCHVGSGRLALTDQRMAEFLTTFKDQSDTGREAIVNYICAISTDDYLRFRSILGNRSEP